MSSSPDAAAAAGRAAFDFEQLAAPPRAERPLRPTDAAARARAIVAGAEAEADRIRNGARDAGFAEGFAAGRAEALRTIEPSAAALASAVNDVRALQERAADAVERQAVELAIHVAERVVAGALEVQPERVLDVVTGALRSIVERERVVVQVSPLDLEVVRDGIDQIRSSLGGIEQLEVQEERRVPPGGAIVRTAVGEVDARIETKLERAKTAIAAELGA